MKSALFVLTILIFSACSRGEKYVVGSAKTNNVTPLAAYSSAGGEAVWEFEHSQETPLNLAVNDFELVGQNLDDCVVSSVRNIKYKTKVGVSRCSATNGEVAPQLLNPPSELKGKAVKPVVIDNNVSLSNLNLNHEKFIYVIDTRLESNGNISTAQAKTIVEGHADIPLDALVDWGDGNQTRITAASVEADRIHTYAVPGIYEIKILGSFARHSFGAASDALAQRLIELKQWGKTPWRDVDYMLSNAVNLKITATDAPNLNHVTSLLGMFQYSSKFNDNVNHWDVSGIKDFSYAFSNCDIYNQPLNQWDMSSAENLSRMFYDAHSFNQPLNSWNVEKVTDISELFYNASSFNQPLNRWKVNQVTDASGTFYGALSYLQDLSQWDLTLASVYDSSFGVAGPMSPSFLIKNLPQGLIYTEDYEQYLTEIQTTLDAGDLADRFITVWKTTEASQTIEFPLDSATTYDFYIDWGDGSAISHITTYNDPRLSHEYAVAGEYKVSLHGSFPRIIFGNLAYEETFRLLGVLQWGSNQWASMESIFSNMKSLRILASDAPDLSNVTSLSYMFHETRIFNESINHWDVSTITDTSYMFKGARSFNQPLNNWNVSNVENFSNMFSSSPFNQSLNNWDVRKVKDMSYMFEHATHFNQSLANWNTASLENMNSMFEYAINFNQPLNHFDLSKVTEFFDVFSSALHFNQPLNNWDVSGITDSNSMFTNAYKYNQDLSQWVLPSLVVTNGFDKESSKNYDWVLPGPTAQ